MIGRNDRRPLSRTLGVALSVVCRNTKGPLQVMCTRTLNSEHIPNIRILGQYISMPLIVSAQISASFLLSSTDANCIAVILVLIAIVYTYTVQLKCRLTITTTFRLYILEKQIWALSHNTVIAYVFTSSFRYGMHLSFWSAQVCGTGGQWLLWILLCIWRPSPQCIENYHSSVYSSD